MSMKRAFFLVGAGILMLASQCLAQGRVGYVDIDKVTRKAPQVTKVMNEVQDQLKGIQDNIEAKKKQISGLKSEIKKSEGVLAAEELDKRRKELDKLTNELDELDLKGRREMQKVDQVVFEPALKLIMMAVQDVAKEQKYDVILRGEAVIYGVSGVDITDAVIAKLTADEKAGGVTLRPDSKTEKTDTAGGKSAKPAETPADTPKEEPKAEVTATPAPPPPPPVADNTPATDEKVQATPEPKETPAPKSTEKKDADQSTPKSDSKTPKPSASKTPGTRPVDRQPE
jgi:outer membrane protein